MFTRERAPGTWRDSTQIALIDEQPVLAVPRGAVGFVPDFADRFCIPAVVRLAADLWRSEASDLQHGLPQQSVRGPLVGHVMRLILLKDPKSHPVNSSYHGAKTTSVQRGDLIARIEKAGQTDEFQPELSQGLLSTKHVSPPGEKTGATDVAAL